MTVHDIGARLPAGFQDANYFAQGGDATSGAHLACNYLHDCLYVSCPWKSVSIRTSAFRAHDRILSCFLEFRRVSGPPLPLIVPGARQAH
jgi:hypothetical protein